MTPGQTFGRPSKYKPEYCQQLIDHMTQGLSYQSFAGVLSVTAETLYQWESTHSEFSDSKRKGREKLRLLFEKIGLNAITGKVPNFNAPTYIFTMKNKLNWTDKVETVNETKTIQINIDKDDADL